MGIGVQVSGVNSGLAFVATHWFEYSQPEQLTGAYSSVQMPVLTGHTDSTSVQVSLVKDASALVARH
jgi:hypothetical protein